MDRIYSARHLLGGPQGRERRHAELSLERSAENFTYRKFRTVIKYFKNPIFKTVIFKILFQSQEMSIMFSDQAYESYKRIVSRLQCNRYLLLLYRWFVSYIATGVWICIFKKCTETQQQIVTLPDFGSSISALRQRICEILTISSQSLQSTESRLSSAAEKCTKLSIFVLTSDARIGCLEVWHEFLGARVTGVQGGVWDRQLAGAPARATSVQMRQHVSRAADATVVLSHAPTEPHPAVPR